MSKSVIASWSGGKDSCFALMQVINQGYVPKALLNMMNENGQVSRSHGIPLELLQQQAKAMGLPITNVPATWSEYETKYIGTLLNLTEKYQLEAAVFGDIDIAANRRWEEKVSQAATLTPLLPLWQQNRRQLVIEMIDSGIKATIVSCNTQLGESFLGRQISLALIDDLEAIGADACGENGEYHTRVTDCPLFDAPIDLPPYAKKVYHNYCFLTWH